MKQEKKARVAKNEAQRTKNLKRAEGPRVPGFLLNQIKIIQISIQSINQSITQASKQASNLKKQINQIKSNQSNQSSNVFLFTFYSFFVIELYSYLNLIL